MPDLVLAEFPETKGCTEAGEPGGGGGWVAWGNPFSGTLLADDP